jgi:hypothetical protein
MNGRQNTTNGRWDRMNGNRWANRKIPGPALVPGDAVTPAPVGWQHPLHDAIER